MSLLIESEENFEESQYLPGLLEASDVQLPDINSTSHCFVVQRFRQFTYYIILVIGALLTKFVLDDTVKEKNEESNYRFSMDYSHDQLPDIILKINCFVLQKWR